MVKLTSTNYSIWRPMMEDLLYCKDLFDPIDVDKTKKDVQPTKPEKMTDKEWEKLKRKTLGTIRQWIDISIFNHVSQETEPLELWRNWRTAHNKASLIKRLVNLKLKPGKSVSEHLSDFQDIINKLTVMKIVLDDELQALFLLSSLPDSWETLVVSISNSALDGTLSLDVIKESMFNEELRRKEMGVDISQALVVENRGRSKSRGPKGRGKSKYRSKSKDGREPTICHYCSKPGHIQKDQQNKKNDHHKEGDDKNTAATTSSSDDRVSLICATGECCHVDSSDIEWLIDTGASYHCVPNKEYFIDYRAGDFGSVKMGNQSSASIVGIGDIRVQTNVGCYLTLRDVRHIPDLRLNLLSANVLDEEGYKHTFGEGKWKLSKGSLTVARGKLCCTLYKTHLKVCSDDQLTGDAPEDGHEIAHEHDHIEEVQPDVIVPQPDDEAVDVQHGESSNQGEKSSPQYIERVLERFNMKNAKQVNTPLAAHFKLSKRCCPTTEKEKESMSHIPYSSAVGSLIYLANPSKVHWEAVKWILRYLRGTSNLSLCFGGGEPILEGFTDADMAGDLDNRKSTSGYLGSHFMAIQATEVCSVVYNRDRIYSSSGGKQRNALVKAFPELGLKQSEYVKSWAADVGAGFFVLEEKKRNRERVLREKRVAGFSGQRDKISDCKRSDRWIVLKFSQLVHNT
uniref:Retrovirus-related Pol polyprotein from transposon TNT 1-94-like beta-barrel domain-containing protein n=1 Tax=Solanum lycopersicum TaxID=4081 RepID=A0A3Q7IYR6_SOLLC